MSIQPESGIFEVLTSILRGAAKLLGCTSANMVLMDGKKGTIRVVVATMAAIRNQVGEVENLVGDVENVAFPLSALSKEAYVYKAWKQRISLETSSLAEIIGPEVMPDEGVEAAMEMLGDHRFFLVPVISGSMSFGVLIFEKPGTNKFSPQQRELLIRYAQRVGEIMDMHMRSSRLPEGADVEPTRESTALIRFLTDGRGRFHAMNNGLLFRPDGGFRFSFSEVLPEMDFPAAFMDEIRPRIRRFLDSDDPGIIPFRFVPNTSAKVGDTGYDVQVEVSMSRMIGADTGNDLALVSFHEIRETHGLATHQLVRMALGEVSPVVLAGPDFCITSENEAADRLFGYEDGEMSGNMLTFLFRDVEDTGDLLDSRMMDLTSGYYEEYALLRRRDGECFPGYVEALLLVDADEKPIGYLVRIREQWAPLEKDDAGDHLVRRERLATMGELGAQLAHEIRNPVLAIGATLESMAEDVQDAGDVETLRSLSCEINRLDMLLRDYLSMASRHNAAMVPVDVADVVADITRLLSGSARWGERELVSKVMPGSMVLADTDSIRHVMFNLVLNAMEATANDGRIMVSMDRGDRDLAIFVDDNGPGLLGNPREVFEPFFTTKAYGTGLGLSVCRRIAQILGGAVSLRNREEGGCRASLVLPVPDNSVVED